MAAALLCLLATLGAVGGLPEIVKIGEECSVMKKDYHKHNHQHNYQYLGGLFDVSDQAESNQETAFR